MTNSRAKGGRGEREASAELSRHIGGQWARSVQRCGKGGGPADVLCSDKVGIHFEVKRQERVSIKAWMRQAERDVEDGSVPVVLWRTNRDEWNVTLRLADVMQFCREIAAIEGRA